MELRDGGNSEVSVGGDVPIPTPVSLPYARDSRTPQPLPPVSLRADSLRSSASAICSPSPWSTPRGPEPPSCALLSEDPDKIRVSAPYLLPNIFKLLHALGHLLEAAINLTWPGRKKAVRILPRRQVSKEQSSEEGTRGYRCSRSQSSTLEFALVRHLPCPTDALSSYSLGDGRCWERLERN